MGSFADLLVRGHADDAVAAVGGLHAADEADDLFGSRLTVRVRARAAQGLRARARRAHCAWRGGARGRRGVSPPQSHSFRSGVRREDPGSIAYGSIGGFSAPGVSRWVESISTQPSGSGLAREHRAAHVGDVVDALAAGEAMRELDDAALGVAVQEHVRLRVEQHRAAHLLRPVIEVRDAPQRGLDAADDDRHVAERFARTLRVHDDRAIRALAAFAARRVRVVAAHAAVGGVAVHHRIHVPGGDAEEQVRAAERPERIGALPVGLGDDARRGSPAPRARGR